MPGLSEGQERFVVWRCAVYLGGGGNLWFYEDATWGSC
jgi:hypothetical protein